MRTYKADYRLCYAHRVDDHTFSQTEKPRMIHGHTADLSIVVNYSSKDTQFRLVDTAVSEVFTFMGSQFFNRFFIDCNDPMYYTLVTSLYESVAEKLGINLNEVNFDMLRDIHTESEIVVAKEVNLAPFRIDRNSPIHDVLKSYVVLDFCPSSDNLCKWFYNIVDSIVSPVGAEVEFVEWSSVPNKTTIYARKNNK